MHWANNCPHNTQSVNVLEDNLDECVEVNIVLMTENLNKNKIAVAETSKSAIIDTAWTKAVAGAKWYQNFKSKVPSD